MSDTEQLGTEQLVLRLLSERPLGRILNAACGLGGAMGGAEGGAQAANLIKRYLNDFVSMVYKPLSTNEEAEKQVRLVIDD